MAALAAGSVNPLAGTGAGPHGRRLDAYGDEAGDEKKSAGGEKYETRFDDERSSLIDDMRNHRRLTGRQIQLLAIAGTIGAFFGLSRFRQGSSGPANPPLPNWPDLR